MSAEGHLRRSKNVLVTVLAVLAMAVGFLAILLFFLPLLGERIALLSSAFGILCAFLALAIAYTRNTQLAVPVIALLVCTTPSAVKSFRDARAVWVESTQICPSPEADYGTAVGEHVCTQLGKRFSGHDCNGPVGRVKCEP